eukprot:5033408-Prymnesium_polylepis.1
MRTMSMYLHLPAGPLPSHLGVQSWRCTLSTKRRHSSCASLSPAVGFEASGPRGAVPQMFSGVGSSTQMA